MNSPSRLAKSAGLFLLAATLLACLPLLAEDKAAVEAWKKDTQQAKKALEKNQFSQAGELYQAAVKDAEKFGPDDSRLAETLNDFARIRLQLREYPDAEVAFHRALAIDEKRLGTNDFHLALEFFGLGEVCGFARRYEEADAYYLRAQSLMAAKFGKFDRMVGECLLARAKVAMMDDRLDVSEKLFKEALDLIQSERTKINFQINQSVTRTVTLPNQAAVAGAFNDLGLLYQKQKKFGDAEAAFNRSLKICEEHYGKNSLMLCDGLYNLAFVYAQQGKLAEAEALLRRSLAILKAADADHPLATQTAQLLDRVLQAKGNAVRPPSPPK